MSDDLYNRIVSRRGSWENLMTRIPLLGKHVESYYNNKAQRDADRIIRGHIADQLKAEIDRLAQAETTILDNGGLMMMSKTRSAKTKLQTLTDRIGTATPGYASGPIRLDLSELAQLFAFDEAMLDYVGTIRAAMDGLQNAANSNEGIDEALRNLEDTVLEADRAFSMRKDVIMNVGQGSPLDDTL